MQTIVIVVTIALRNIEPMGSPRTYTKFILHFGKNILWGHRDSNPEPIA